MVRGNVMILKSSSTEWLRDAVEHGLLNGEALKHSEQVLKEVDELRRENNLLRGRVHALEQVRNSYRDGYFEALEYKYNDENKKRRGSAIRAFIGTILVLTTISIIAITVMIAVSI